jgi:hypothetical protein
MSYRIVTWNCRILLTAGLPVALKHKRGICLRERSRCFLYVQCDFETEADDVVYNLWDLIALGQCWQTADPEGFVSEFVSDEWLRHDFCYFASCRTGLWMMFTIWYAVNTQRRSSSLLWARTDSWRNPHTAFRSTFEILLSTASPLRQSIRVAGLETPRQWLFNALRCMARAMWTPPGSSDNRWAESLERVAIFKYFVLVGSQVFVYVWGQSIGTRKAQWWTVMTSNLPTLPEVNVENFLRSWGHLCISRNTLVLYSRFSLWKGT